MYEILETNVFCRNEPILSAPVGNFHLPAGAQFTLNEMRVLDGTVWLGNLRVNGKCWLPSSVVAPATSNREAVALAIADRILNRPIAEFDEYVEVDNLLLSDRFGLVFKTRGHYNCVD